jgi:hypothetical protein
MTDVTVLLALKMPSGRLVFTGRVFLAVIFDAIAGLRASMRI